MRIRNSARRCNLCIKRMHGYIRNTNKTLFMAWNISAVFCTEARTATMHVLQGFLLSGCFSHSCIRKLSVTHPIPSLSQQERSFSVWEWKGIQHLKLPGVLFSQTKGAKLFVGCAKNGTEATEFAFNACQRSNAGLLDCHIRTQHFRLFQENN